MTHYVVSVIVSDVVFYQVTEHKVCWIRPDVLVSGQSEIICWHCWHHHTWDNFLSHSFRPLKVINTINQIPSIIPLGVGTAQLVEHPTEKPGATLTWVRAPGAARDFSPSVAFHHRLTVLLQLPYTIACINTCQHVKNPKRWQPYHCLDTRKYCTR